MLSFGDEYHQINFEEVSSVSSKNTQSWEMKHTAKECFNEIIIVTAVVQKIYKKQRICWRKHALKVGVSIMRKFVICDIYAIALLSSCYVGFFLF